MAILQNLFVKAERETLKNFVPLIFEPIMLLILPTYSIILSRISHIFHPLFLFYSHTSYHLVFYNYSTNFIVKLYIIYGWLLCIFSVDNIINSS